MLLRNEQNSLLDLTCCQLGMRMVKGVCKFLVWDYLGLKVKRKDSL